MSDLQDVLESHVSDGSVPGAVGLLARGDRVETCVVGSTDVDGSAPMARDSIFRIASATKPITAAAVMLLVDDGRIALDSEIRTWLPELASPSVVRTPSCPVDDVVPAARPVTVEDLLTFRCGWGFPSDFSLPAVEPLFSILQQGPLPASMPPDEWITALAGVPMLNQPGDVWLYNTGSDVLGVLVARVSGQALPDFLQERLFGPLGMVDTGFEVPAAAQDRLVDYYRPSNGGLELVDDRDGRWSGPPVFPSGSGGLVSTVDDWLAFGRMLLAGGRGLLSPRAVELMRNATPAPCSWRARAGGSAAPSTSHRWVRGTCPGATAGWAAPAPRPTSSRRRGRSPSCSARWR